MAKKVKDSQTEEALLSGSGDDSSQNVAPKQAGKEKKPKKEKKLKEKKENHSKKGTSAELDKKAQDTLIEQTARAITVTGVTPQQLTLTKRSPLLKPFIRIVTYYITMRRNLSIEKVRVQNLKPPYILICSHQSFSDYLVVERAAAPFDVNHLVEASEFVNGEALMKSLGCIPLRRFSADGQLLYHIKETILQKKIVAIYPEAHLSLDGMNSPLPDSLFKIIKTMKVPVVVLKIRGNYIAHPCWSKNTTKASIEAMMTQVITAEDTNTLEPEEIGNKINTAFRYDEYWWQVQNNVLITSKQRAEGLEHILYLCPICGSEYHIATSNSTIYCERCGQEWNYSELGNLEMVSGTLREGVLEDLRNAERDIAQKRFDTARMEQATKDYMQAKRAYDYAVRKRDEELELRKELVADARQRLETPPEFEPLPNVPDRPEPVTKLEFVPVVMPEPEPLPELSRIPHWMEFQRSKVKAAAENATYHLDIPVHVEVLRNLSQDFISLGDGMLHHSPTGFVLSYKDVDGQTKNVTKAPLTTYSVHIDFDYKGKGPFIDLSTADDTFYLYPKTGNCSVTKVALAAEELYKLARKLLKEQGGD